MSYFSSLMKLNELKINGEIVDEDDYFNVEEDQATADPVDVANDVAEDENTEQNQQEQDDAQQPNNEDDLEDTEEDDFTIDETDDEEDNFTLDDEVEDDTDNPPPPTDIGEAENAPANQPANDNAGGGDGNDPAPANDTATAANQEVTGNDAGGGEADDGLGDNAADDFNIDAGGGGTADTGDGGGQPQKQEDPLPENPSDNVKDEEKRAAEESIYDSLTDDQKRIRVLQLKIDYKDLYETIVTTMEGINDIPKTVENLDTIKRLNIFLGKAKQILIDYIENNFDTTTYIENYTMYLKYLAVFRTVAKVIEELNNYSEKIDSKKGD